MYTGRPLVEFAEKGIDVAIAVIYYVVVEAAGRSSPRIPAQPVHAH